MMRATILALLVLRFAAGAAPAPDPHVEAVTRIVEGAKGRVEKTADGQSLRLVDLAVPGTGPHDHRTEDPYDAAFFEHLGHVTTLESLNIISTKFSDDWMPHIAGLTNLKTLRFTNNGKLTDAGMEQLAGLKNLESFSFVGTAITGNAYAKFEGFTKLTRVSHRGSSIHDEGLKQLCEHLPNLENISLAHAKFTDAGAPNLAKLTKLKGLELGASKATPQALANITKLPLEYLQLGEGFEAPECIALIKGITTLKRLTLTNAAKFSDAELTTVAGLTQLEHLELKAPFPDERLPVLKDFAFLKSMRLVPVKDPFTTETQAKIKALLPKTEIQFK
ncbi:MAG TPA: G protein-coupled receptor LGR4 [Planctomycetota bacterium]|nr:G protein-coupled receptor LGR4 [Planctomycetota bacterium]